MTDFLQLDPQTRCVALVGTYLQCWSLMESALNEALAMALELDTLAEITVAKNTQLRDKVKILQTMMNYMYTTTKNIDHYKKAIQKISDLSSFRNMAAHDPFLPDDAGDGFHFYVTKAAGSLQMLNTKVSVEEFIEKFNELIALTSQIKAAKNLLKESNAARAAGSNKPLVPNLLYDLLGHPSGHSLPPLGYPHTGLATLGTPDGSDPTPHDQAPPETPD